MQHTCCTDSHSSAYHGHVSHTSQFVGTSSARLCSSLILVQCMCVFGGGAGSLALRQPQKWPCCCVGHCDESPALQVSSYEAGCEAAVAQLHTHQLLLQQLIVPAAEQYRRDFQHSGRAHTNRRSFQQHIKAAATGKQTNKQQTNSQRTGSVHLRTSCVQAAAAAPAVRLSRS